MLLNGRITQVKTNDIAAKNFACKYSPVRVGCGCLRLLPRVLNLPNSPAMLITRYLVTKDGYIVVRSDSFELENEV